MRRVGNALQHQTQGRSSYWTLCLQSQHRLQPRIYLFGQLQPRIYLFGYPFGRLQPKPTRRRRHGR